MRRTSSELVLDPSAKSISFSSEQEILPSPFLSNLLKILRTSSSMAA
ncbi:hypothetical protein Ahy_A07g032156 [Arachis hypogaea]|uniref:Uncharacterized protein n=1 Tax=Arachis hypogaea TaxID=3818 RepID=A0A445C685_ARAHY|nr:hypothetical protein Ahy_A07g032156 [Arachis hypogaea]